MSDNEFFQLGYSGSQMVLYQAKQPLQHRPVLGNQARDLTLYIARHHRQTLKSKSLLLSRLATRVMDHQALISNRHVAPSVTKQETLSGSCTASR